MSLTIWDIISWSDVIFAVMTMITCLLLGMAGALFIMTWSDRYRDDYRDDRRPEGSDHLPPSEPDWY